MDLENRMIYSSTEALQSVEKALDRLKALRYDGQYRLLLGDALISRLEDWDRNIRARKDDPFTLVVIGDFKRGKSTFINALLGSEVVTTDVTTETVTFNRVSYGEASNEAVLSHGRRLLLSDEELRRENLEGVLREVKEPVRRLELKRPCPFLKDVTIIDTPGTGDAMQDFGREVEEYLLQADAVVYLYSVRYPLSQSEQMFLKAAVLPQQYTKLFLVGNYADTAGNTADFERVRREVAGRIQGLLPGAEIYTVSALDELCRQLGERRPCRELSQALEEQFAKLREDIAVLVREKKETVIVERMQRLAGAMLHELEEDLDRIEQGLSMSREEAGERLKALEREQAESREKQSAASAKLEKRVLSMQGEATAWMGEFVSRLQAEAGNLQSASTEDLMKYYSYYCVDLLQKAMNTCVEYHREELFEALQGISDDLARELSAGFAGGDSYHFRFSFDNKIWTAGDNIGLAVSFISNMIPLTMIAGVVADGISGHLRQREIGGTQKGEILRRIAAQMSTLEGSVTATITQMYTKLGSDAQKCIADFYQEELSRSRKLAEQWSGVANSEEAEKEKIRQALENARTLFHQAREEIQPLF